MRSDTELPREKLKYGGGNELQPVTTGSKPEVTAKINDDDD